MDANGWIREPLLLWEKEAERFLHLRRKLRPPALDLGGPAQVLGVTAADGASGGSGSCRGTGMCQPPVPGHLLPSAIPIPDPDPLPFLSGNLEPLGSFSSPFPSLARLFCAKKGSPVRATDRSHHFSLQAPASRVPLGREEAPFVEHTGCNFPVRSQQRVSVVTDCLRIAPSRVITLNSRLKDSFPWI